MALLLAELSICFVPPFARPINTLQQRQKLLEVLPFSVPITVSCCGLFCPQGSVSICHFLRLISVTFSDSNQYIIGLPVPYLFAAQSFSLPCQIPLSTCTSSSCPPPSATTSLSTALGRRKQPHPVGSSKRALQKLKAKTGRGTCVPHGWLKAQIETRTAAMWFWLGLYMLCKSAAPFIYMLGLYILSLPRGRGLGGGLQAGFLACPPPT